MQTYIDYFLNLAHGTAPVQSRFVTTSRDLKRVAPPSGQGIACWGFRFFDQDLSDPKSKAQNIQNYYIGDVVSIEKALQEALRSAQQEDSVIMTAAAGISGAFVTDTPAYARLRKMKEYETQGVKHLVDAGGRLRPLRKKDVVLDLRFKQVWPQPTRQSKPAYQHFPG